MTTGWKYGRILPEKLMRLEEPGKSFLFDADKGLIEETTGKFNLSAISTDLKEKCEVEAQKVLEALGINLMKFIIDLADGKYLDRTGEMVEKVYKQTGISFPHRLDRYIELSILGLRPSDRWEITRATTHDLVLKVSACSFYKSLKNAGIDGLPCKEFCFASFYAAADKTNDRININMPKSLLNDGFCEFIISLRPGG